MSSGGAVSEDARVLERVVQDRLLDCGEDEADVGGIGGLCQTAAVMSMRGRDGAGQARKEKRTHCGYRFKCARLTWLNLQSRYLAALLTSFPPE